MRNWLVKLGTTEFNTETEIMNQIVPAADAPAQSVVLPMLTPNPDVFEVPTYETVEVIIPRELSKQLKGMTSVPQALKLARIFQEKAAELPLIAVISISGMASSELRFQSARTGDLLLVSDRENRDWKAGRPEGLLKVLTAALEEPTPFEKINFNSPSN
jgi:hypothetical protein